MNGFGAVGFASIDGFDDFSPPYVGDVLTLMVDVEAAVEALMDAEPAYLATLENDLADREDDVGKLFGGANRNRIVLKRVRDPAVDGYISDLTATLTLYDQDGNAVANASAVTMVYTAGSSGEYRGTIPASARLVPGSKYTARVVGSNYELELEREFECIVRKG